MFHIKLAYKPLGNLDAHPSTKITWILWPGISWICTRKYSHSDSVLTFRAALERLLLSYPNDSNDDFHLNFPSTRQLVQTAGFTLSQKSESMGVQHSKYGWTQSIKWNTWNHQPTNQPTNWPTEQPTRHWRTPPCFLLIFPLFIARLCSFVPWMPNSEFW